MAKITIIMPSLNVVRYIDECLNSVVNQTLQDIEIIIVDAGSTDGTLEIIKNYINKYENIQLMESVYKSYGYQVNIGIERATGDYIAIVETDDYVDRTMYQVLYERAYENNLDYVISDYDQFYVNKNNVKVFKHNSTWNDSNKYNRILDKDYLASDYSLHPSLWRGIYKRSYLIEHNIKFNESAGAAYQDIGFIHQVKIHAKRVMFLPDSFYKYRTDREESSVNSSNGLKYIYQEYKSLFELKNIEDEYYPGIYYMMTYSMISEITHAHSITDIKWLEDNGRYYDWLIEKVRFGLSKGYINEACLEQKLLKKIKLCQISLKAFWEKLDEYGNLDELIIALKSKSVIVFGAGKWAREFYSKAKDKINIVGFVDNNSQIWGENICGYKVMSVEDSIVHNKDFSYVIAIKRETQDIEIQLKKLGVADDKIFIFSEL